MDDARDEEPAEGEGEGEQKEKKKCRVCRQRHSGPTPICPNGPY